MSFSTKTVSILALSALALASCSKAKHHDDSAKFIPGNEFPISISQRTADDFVGHWELTDASGLTTVDIVHIDGTGTYRVTTTEANGTITTSDSLEQKVGLDGFVSLVAQNGTLENATYSIPVALTKTGEMYVATASNPSDMSRAFAKTGETPNPAS